MKLLDFLNQLAAKMGQGRLADESGINGSALSRFRSGQGALPLSTIEKILEVGGGGIISRAELRRMEDALEVMSDLWKAERENGKK